MWEDLTIGDVCEVIAGQSPEGKYYNTEGDGLAFYQGKKDFGAKFVGSPSKWTTQVTKEAQAGDVLMSVRAPVGPINFATEQICIGRGLAAIRPSNKVNKDFLFYGLLGKQKEICGNEGAVFASINKAQISAISFPLPPLEEQKRIVGILDEAFAGIDQAIANTEKNLSNFKELFERVLSTEIFCPSNQDGFLETIVADVAQPEKGSMRTGPFGSQLLKREFVDDGIAVLGIDNVVKNYFRWGKERFITPEKFKEMKRFQVKPGDVLITIMGTCGRCVIVPDDIPTAINTKHICCISLDRSKCIPAFLHAYFLHHPVAQTYLLSKAKGAIMAGLNMGIIKELPLLLPSLREQEIIVKKIEQFKAKTQLSEAVYQQKLTTLKELKQSLLQKAFAGELTADMQEAA